MTETGGGGHHAVHDRDVDPGFLPHGALLEHPADAAAAVGARPHVCWLKWASILPCGGRPCGPSHVRNGVRLGWAESCSKWREARWTESQLRPVGAVSLELLGLMVSANDPTSGIRARGHGFDSCMLQMCVGAGGGIVGLNGPASCPVAGGHVGRVIFEMA
uniref:Uncharacterized protein n=1 Tax=Ananas comosus var. bracteatus TaxID=296719 RepID=A0A6V7NXY6_ANACO|nr:unnamed protein product [Ananas comosus var. bracteatus]